MTTTLYLVRHAHSIWTLDENRPLSAQGFEDAPRVADILEPLPISAIYSSPARRALQTIEPLASRKGLTVKTFEDLRERVLGNIEPLDFMKAIKMTWEDATLVFPGGESNITAQSRGLAVLEEIVRRHAGEEVVVASHGNLLAVLLQAYDSSYGFSAWERMSMPDIYKVVFRRDSSASITRLWQPV
jgi:2,3-bisphosphoglycerate-dependent phosphoglycerate mutase